MHTCTHARTQERCDADDEQRPTETGHCRALILPNIIALHVHAMPGSLWLHVASSVYRLGPLLQHPFFASNTPRRCGISKVRIVEQTMSMDRLLFTISKTACTTDSVQRLASCTSCGKAPPPFARSSAVPTPQPPAQLMGANPSPLHAPHQHCVPWQRPPPTPTMRLSSTGCPAKIMQIIIMIM